MLDRVRDALIRNPDYCPEGWLPLGEAGAPQGPAGVVLEARQNRHEEAPTPEPAARAAPSAPPKKPRLKRPQLKQLTPSAVIKRLKLGQHGMSCCVDHLGPDGPECYTEGGVVYLNRDHPLHQRFATQAQAYSLYLARLLTQEIVMMKRPKSLRQAFDWQSKLLRDALAGDGRPKA